MLPLCSRGGDPKLSSSPNIVAGPAEQTFSQRYHIRLVLPMDEGSFVRLLHRLKLDYEVFGERGTPREIPPLRHSKNIELREIMKCLQIYGNDKHVGREIYRAYIDNKGRVVYVENAFAYPEPGY